jgi:RNA polymerase sigma-70 factor (ECF subfamily)
MCYDTAWRILGNVNDTQDAVQEAFLDAVRMGNARVENWGGLLRRLVARRAIDLLRTRRARLDLKVDAPAPAQANPLAIAVGCELAERLREAIGQLPDREGEVFVLRYFADLSNSEIAAFLNLSAGAVGVALHKARTRLAESLGTDEE